MTRDELLSRLEQMESRVRHEADVFGQTASDYLRDIQGPLAFLGEHRARTAASNALDALALSEARAALEGQAQNVAHVLALGLCPECGPVSAVDAERCCTGCGADVGMFDRPTLVTTADLWAQGTDTAALQMRLRNLCRSLSFMNNQTCNERNEKARCAECAAELALDTLSARVETLEQQLAAQGWQPIETAPKNQTRVLLACGEVLEGYWVEDDDGGDWYRPGVDGGLIMDPSHWMPLLPAPPTEEN